ncbi:diheme cytochrome c [Curvibacter sp. PAE-UM]|uniref:diheme cytochrome c n=1 Tax=Curvibacter sp. PAE-UM TaxID=1714344 RepID=UPI00070C7045|nr:diheme cytochrome c [Curvibacter sp. PAE-UM]KRI00926.1 cytochrome C [Curvibacter sp. PAE-UM]
MQAPTQTRTLKRTLPALALLLGLTTAALADSGNLNPRQMLPSYQQECAACHLAYPPGLLPARSWGRIMNGLDQHYGTDASLDAATVQQIGQWLQAKAGTTKRVSAEPPQDRITESAWFLRKHRKLDAPVWQHASVKSAANCAACHTRAEQGSFDESQLQFPRGLDARYRRAFQD